MSLEPALSEPSSDLQQQVRVALERSLGNLQRVQQERGCWVGEAQWCTMLASQYVLTHHLLGRPLRDARREKILRHLRVTVTPEGGWALGPEMPPYVFTTALAYVALRLLDVPAEDPLCARALAWLRAEPERLLEVPTWGKFWLALCGLYGWEGVNPLPPELWLLPESASVHPRRFYNHTRLIYLAMGYLWGRRLTGPLTPRILELRQELYARPFERIDFGAYRHRIAGTDVYQAPSRVLRLAYDAVALLERLPFKGALRRRALDRCFEHLVYELEQSNYVSISPVNGLLNVLAVWDRKHPHFERALAGVEYWAWEDEAEGLRYCGAHSHTWDTAFTMQALLEAPEPVVSAAMPNLERAAKWLDATQFRTELPERERFYRDRIQGGWCFSDEVHRWPVSDCTAEAVAALLALEPRLPPSQRMSERWLEEAGDFILSRQNDDGGFGSFERNRGAKLLEDVNPSEMYGNCMVEHSYNECTSSCVHALSLLRRRLPTWRRAEVDRAVERGVQLLLTRQSEEGTWEAVWAVHYTYSAWYAVEALTAAGLPTSHPAVKRAVGWLLAHQLPDGGWGEHPSSAALKRYIPHERSQVIQTAWAVLALTRGGCEDREAVERGVRVLLERQKADGDWPEESPAGVFFHTALMQYRMYRMHFTTWALARFARA